ncbi:MAG: glutathione peroxidase [Granulosicoccus sp.]
MTDTLRRDYLRLGFGLLAGLLLPQGGLVNASDTDGPDMTTGNNTCKPLLSHTMRPLMEPDSFALCDRFASKVLLIVNTASRCGFTPQFEGLEELQQRYASQGFQVLGFPSADFRQELQTEEEVAEFCELNYGVTFPMFEKISVTGETAHPLYQDLAQATGTFPRWNFNKYLISRDAEVVSHYNSGMRPLDAELISDIERLL